MDITISALLYSSAVTHSLAHCWIRTNNTPPRGVLPIRPSEHMCAGERSFSTITSFVECTGAEDDQSSKRHLSNYAAANKSPRIRKSTHYWTRTNNTPTFTAALPIELSGYMWPHEISPFIRRLHYGARRSTLIRLSDEPTAHYWN